MVIWIIAIVLGLLVALFMKVISGPITKSLTGRAARLNDSLSEFGGSHGADRVLGPEVKESPVRLYEKMCVLEPSKWVGDSRIPEVIKRYGDIVSGREPDPDGFNVPSTHIDGRQNPDYVRYLKNQRKHVGEALENAVKATMKVIKEQKIREGFNEAMVELGMPEKLIPWANTDARLDSYTPDQWKSLVKAMKAVCDKYSEELAIDMLTHFTDPDVLCSEEAAETFDALCKQDVPFSVSCSVVNGEMTMDQAQRAVDLVEEWDYGWDEAVKEVVAKDTTKALDEDLRRSYARKANPRA